MSFGYGRGPDPAASWNAMGQGTAGTATPQGVLDYMQDVLSGRVAANGVLSQQRAPYDLNKSLRENLPEISPQAIDIAMGIGPGAIRAFHGSPYSFNRFRSSQIGTGEGAQAYGHGLYFAEAEPVAESYLKNARWQYGGRNAQTIYDRLNSQAMERGLDNAGWDNLNAQRGFWEKVALGRAPRSIIDDARANPGEYGPAELSYIQSLDPAKFKRTGGNMYEVNVDVDPEHLLNWDRPLGGQSKPVQDVLSGLGFPSPQSQFSVRPANGGFVVDYPGGTSRTFKTAEEAQRAANSTADMTGVNPSGGDIYEKLTKRFLSDAGTSRVLEKSGIPGIRYLDQGSRAAGQGTSNYVIFNDKLIDILRKYGIVGPVVGAGALAGGNGGGEY